MESHGAIVNVGRLIQAIKQKGWSGIDEAASNCHTSTVSFRKLFKGEIPRLDALFRICDGCGIKVQELIVGSSSISKRKKIALHPKSESHSTESAG